MSITVTFSTTNGGSEISGSLDHGDQVAGDNTTAQTIYIEHDGNNSLNNFRIYIDEKSGTYSGSKTAAQDKAEILGWGDNTAEGTFGGVQFNFDAVGGFPSSAWGTYDDKSPTNGNTARTGIGDSAANGMILPITTNISSIGEIPVGSAQNIRFKMRIKIPSSGAATGVRQFDLKCAFSYTS
jgi:hypothetical protein